MGGVPISVSYPSFGLVYEKRSTLPQLVTATGHIILVPSPMHKKQKVDFHPKQKYFEILQSVHVTRAINAAPQHHH